MIDRQSEDKSGTLGSNVQINEPLIHKKQEKEISDSNMIPKKEDEDEVQQVIEKYKYLEEPLNSEILKKAAHDTLTLIPKCSLVGLAFSLTPLQNAVGYFILNIRDETVLQGSFGVYTMFRSLLFTTFFHAIALRMSISASQCFGGGADLSVGKKYLTQAYLLFLIHFVVIYYPFTMFCEEILVAMNITDDIANGFKQIAIKCLVNDFFDVVQQFIMEYCYAQNIESIFSPIGWTNFGISMVISLVLAFTLDMGFDGWIIGRTIYYLMNIVAFLVVYYTKTNKKSRGLCSISEAMKGFPEFVKGALGFYVGSVFEWVGFEVGTYFVALFHDNNQIAAFASAVSIVNFIYHFGLGFLVIGRTRINYLLGAGFHRAAKKIAAIVIAAGIISGLLVGLLVFLIRVPVAKLYASSNDETYNYFKRLLVLYAMYLSTDVNYGCIVTVMRSTNHVAFCAMVLFTCCFILNGGMCMYMRAYWVIDCTDVFVSVYTMVVAALVTCTIKGFTYDWSKVKLAGDGHTLEAQVSVLGVSVLNNKLQAVRSKFASVLVNAR